jgi:hypothetical protein
MAKITFQTNVPVELRLQSIEGELTPSQFGGNQIKFTAHEGPFWVSEAVGSILMDQIRKKRIAAMVPVEVCRREMAQGNGRKGIHWTIDTVGFAPGEQPDGTFVLPKVGANGGPAPPAPPAAPKAPPLASTIVSSPNGTANGNGHAAAAGTPDAWEAWAARIRLATQMRLRLYVDLCKWAAEEYGGAVSKQEVSSYLMNVLISSDKNGGAR